VVDTADIYTWLLEHDPSESPTIRMAWSNLASYCYFINVMDFDRSYQDKLQKVLLIGEEHRIEIPGKNHRDVLELAQRMPDMSSTMNLGDLLCRP
jgi:hypothetical protein